MKTARNLVALLTVISAFEPSHAKNLCSQVFTAKTDNAKWASSEITSDQRRKTPLYVSRDGSQEVISDDSNQLVVRNRNGESQNVRINGQFAGFYFEQLSDDGLRLTIGSRSYSKAESPVLEHPATDSQRVDPGVRVIDLATGNVINKFSGGSDTSVSPDGKTIAAKTYGERSTVLYDVDSGKVIRKFSAMGVDFNPDGKRMLVGGMIYDSLVDIQTGKVLMRFFDHGRGTFNPKGDRIIYVNGRKVTERNTATGEITFSAKLPKGANKYTNTSQIKFSGDDKIVAIYFDQQNVPGYDRERTYLLNRETGKSTILPFGYSYKTHISPDGRFIVVSDVTQVGVYDTTTFEKVYEFIPEMYFKNMIHEAYFANGGNELVINRDKSSTVVTIKK